MADHLARACVRACVGMCAEAFQELLWNGPELRVDNRTDGAGLQVTTCARSCR